MSMTTLTALQLLGIFSVYAVMTLMLPAILLYHKISSMNFTVRFMVYQTIGNFYIITLVMILQLLHISNWFTLVLFTVVSFAAAYAFFHDRNPQQDLQVFLDDFQKLVEGKYGLRLFLNRGFMRIGKAIRKFWLIIWKRLRSNFLDVVLVCAVIAAVMGTYGVNAFMQYGYCTSDIVVHNYWINYMSKGEIFVAGVYPFGFHCLIYYLHTVFFIDTYVLLRLFWVIQTLVIHLMLLGFIRLCCKSKYLAYLGLGIFTLVELFRVNTYTRYISSLPQEFGMIFILPSAAFLFLFFQQRKTELAGGPEEEEKSAGQKKSRKLKKDKKIKKGKKIKRHTASESQPQEEERIYLLDEVLAESAAREAALKEEAERRHLPLEEVQHQEDDPEDEAILVIEENPEDGSLYVRQMPLKKQTFDADSENGSGSRPDGTAAERTAVDRKWKRFCHALRREYETESSWYLFFFMVNFSLTLTVHFYNTMIAGLLCIGIVFGYGFRLFHRKYFCRVLFAGVMAVAVSILPMFLAYLGGTPLEGSLRWGMEVINGTAGQANQAAQKMEEQEDEDFNLKDIEGFVVLSDSKVMSSGKVISRNGTLEGGQVVSVGDIVVDQHSIEGGQMVENAKILDDGEVIYEGNVIVVGYDLPEKGQTNSAVAEAGEQFYSFTDKIRNGMSRIVRTILNTMDAYLIYRQISWVSTAIPISIILLFVLAILFFILRQTDYAARMMSVAVFMGLMTLMFAAPGFGLPELMDDEGRTCVYYAYTIISLWCLCIDGILQVLFSWRKQERILQIVSFALIPLVAVVVLVTGSVKDVQYTEAMQSNDAVICLTNIIKDNKDQTWTIVSANDELRMGEDHGFHYELDTFLRDMENRGGGSTIEIPTKKVYFFIERRPINYALPYDGSGQRISRKGASNPLPFRSGVTMYQGENRWIEMSRISYWMEMFKSMYPHEVEVYYDTNDFICYCVNQNEYSLFNFSINYLYNMMDFTEEATE